jgi:hypothetical protein
VAGLKQQPASENGATAVKQLCCRQWDPPQPGTDRWHISPQGPPLVQLGDSFFFLNLGSFGTCRFFDKRRATAIGFGRGHGGATKGFP